MQSRHLLIVLAIIGLLTACSGKASHHATPMPDPQSYNAHFGDMDTSGDEQVDWDEFQTHFPHAEPKVFEAIDLNQDGVLDHDEWHAFKQAHGLKHHG